MELEDSTVSSFGREKVIYCKKWATWSLVRKEGTLSAMRRMRDQAQFGTGRVEKLNGTWTACCQAVAKFGGSTRRCSGRYRKRALLKVASLWLHLLFVESQDISRRGKGTPPDGHIFILFQEE